MPPIPSTPAPPPSFPQRPLPPISPTLPDSPSSPVTPPAPPRASRVRSAPRALVALALLAFGFAALPIEARPRRTARPAIAAEGSRTSADGLTDELTDDLADNSAAPAAASKPKAADEPSFISITPHHSAAEKLRLAAREAERRLALAPIAVRWVATFRQEGSPLVDQVAHALDTLRITSGRAARTVCHPLREQIDRLAAALPPAPADALEKDVRSALDQLALGAYRCLEGRPTSAQTDLGRGSRRLAAAVQAIAAWSRLAP